MSEMDAPTYILVFLLSAAAGASLWELLVPIVSDYLKRRRASETDEDEGEGDTPDADGMNSGSDDLPKPVGNDDIVDVLKNMGCNPEVNDSGIHFAYQGKNFVMEGNDSHYARRIVMPWIVAREATDVIDIQNLLDAANRAMVESWGGKYVTHLTQIDGVETFGMSLMLDHFFILPGDNLEPYLRALLDSFFESAGRLAARYNENNNQTNIFSEINYTPDNRNSFMANNLN